MLFRARLALSLSRAPVDRNCFRAACARNVCFGFAFPYAWSNEVRQKSSRGEPSERRSFMYFSTRSKSPLAANGFAAELYVKELGWTPARRIFSSQCSQRSPLPAFAHAAITALKVMTLGSTPASSIFASHFSASCTSPARAHALIAAV